MAVMGIAGELAGEQSNGPGSLQVNLLDAFFNLTEEAIGKQLKVEG
jgi:hydroxyethylthiazole kinase